MKKLLIISILFLYGNAFSQWIWQNPLPQGNELKFVKFFNSQTGYAMGNSTTLIKTTNGGDNWEKLRTDSAFYNINSVYFIDSANWWATGTDWGIILKTTNSGANWTLLTNIEYLQYSSCFFLNKNTGYFTSANHVSKTTNGGLNWEYNFFVSPSYLNSIFFTSELTGYTAGNYGIILKTTNGGSNWYSQNSLSTKDLFNIRFLDQNTGWILNNDSILITTNGGINWVSRWPNLSIYIPYPPGSYSLYLRTFYFTNYLTGWVSASSASLTSNYINKTTNGGLNWSYIPVTYSVNNIYTIDSQKCVAVGLNGNIFASSNAGLNWNSLVKGLKDYIYDIFFVNPQKGWAASSLGRVLKTTNGGTSWDTNIFVTNNTVNCVNFIDENTGWVVSGFSGGSGWGIFKTTNSGLNWNILISGGSGGYSLSSINFLNPQTGFAVGSEIIMKTTNGGNNWQFYSDSNSNGSFYKVQFPDFQTGYIFGYQYMLKTTNQGNNWFKIADGITDNGSFINAQTGWVNTRFHIIKTTNGGNSWNNQLNVSGSEMFRNVFFVNSQLGYVVNNTGSLLKTTNGGQNWCLQRITQYWLYSVFFLDSTTGWIAGSNGTILKTTNGGSSVRILNNQQNIPESFSLYQNYPNPFNPTTNIRFLVRKNGFVTLKIYDILGKEIETLVNENMQAGEYEIQFSNSGLSSGIYFYRIESEGFVQTKKMVLIK